MKYPQTEPHLSVCFGCAPGQGAESGFDLVTEYQKTPCVYLSAFASRVFPVFERTVTGFKNVES